MTNYRRNFTAGGSFFFTVNLEERRLRLLTEHIDELRSAFRETRRHHPFTSMRWLCCLIISTRSGRCPKTMPILPRAGG
jgi:REP element-mobilizing transposase RayT